MKLKQVITENTDVRAMLKQYFDMHGTVSETANGISVDGDVEIKEGKRLKELPIAFDKISGTLDLTNAGLENLNNFPREVGDVFLDTNPTLTSLATQYPVVCSGTFSAKSIGITDLTGFQVNGIRKFYLNGCKNLQSLDGTSVNIGIVFITKCNALQADLTKYKNIKEIQADVVSGTSFPLTRILAFGSIAPSIKLQKGDTADPGLWKIIQKYQGKGPENVLDIMRDLRDAGYKNNARI